MFARSVTGLHAGALTFAWCLFTICIGMIIGLVILREKVVKTGITEIS